MPVRGGVLQWTFLQVICRRNILRDPLTEIKNIYLVIHLFNEGLFCVASCNCEFMFWKLFEIISSNWSWDPPMLTLDQIWKARLDVMKLPNSGSDSSRLQTHGFCNASHRAILQTSCLRDCNKVASLLSSILRIVSSPPREPQTPRCGHKRGENQRLSAGRQTGRSHL